MLGNSLLLLALFLLLAWRWGWRRALRRIWEGTLVVTVYFGIALAIPFIALFLLSVMNSNTQWAPAVAVVGGFGGVGAAFTIVRRLQSDLDALVVVTSDDLRRSAKQ